MSKSDKSIVHSPAILNQVYFRSMVALLGLALLLAGSWASFLLLSQNQDVRRQASEVYITPSPSVAIVTIVPSIIPSTPPTEGCVALPSCYWTRPACNLPIGPRYCQTADLNLDGFVNQADFEILRPRFLNTTKDALTADINRDGVINLFDYSIMVEQWTGGGTN